MAACHKAHFVGGVTNDYAPHAASPPWSVEQVVALESDQSLETDDAVMADTRPRNDCDRDYLHHYCCYLARTPRQTVLSSGPAIRSVGGFIWLSL
jgi:hypothetical protein